MPSAVLENTSRNLGVALVTVVVSPNVVRLANSFTIPRVATNVKGAYYKQPEVQQSYDHDRVANPRKPAPDQLAPSVLASSFQNFSRPTVRGVGRHESSLNLPKI